MNLYCESNNYKLYNDNMLNMLEDLEESSIDVIITDPPYELNFMNKGWDNSGVAFQKETWEKCLRVLKPGGYLLAFGHSRLYHRMACAIEDAGFEVRETLMWIYSSGMPHGINIANAIEGKVLHGSANKKDQKKLSGTKSKSSLGYHKMGAEQNYRPHNYNGRETIINPDITTVQAQEWIGWNSTLKPAYEPIIMARKPFNGSLIDNIMEHRIGGINIDECRISHSGESDVGRFPTNVILSYDDSSMEEVCGGFPYSKSTGGKGESSIKGALGKNVYNGGYSHTKIPEHLGGIGDEGSNARFFKNCQYSDEDFADYRRYCHCAKTSQKDKHEGCVKNTHPTVKPTALLTYLITMVAPKGATILDPFNGSGSTGKAAMSLNKNYKYIGIELSKEYCDIAKQRIDYSLSKGTLF